MERTLWSERAVSVGYEAGARLGDLPDDGRVFDDALDYSRRGADDWAFAAEA